MIYDLDSIDIMGVRKDGGVDMFIISTGPLDESPETQTALLDKIQSYIGHIHSNEFIEKHGKLPQGKIKIILKCDEEPCLIIKKLSRKIDKWVRKSGASFKMEIKR